MKVKFGGMIVGGRGKFAGLVGSHNRGGDYFRQFVVPTNPATADQTTVRNRFAVLAQSWRSLTQDQRDQWTAAVSNYQRTNIFGDLKTPTGNTLYSRLNGNIRAAGGTPITVPALPAGVQTFQTLSCAISTGGGTAVLTFTNAIGATAPCILEATPALSPGVTNANNKFRQIEVLTNADVTPYDFATSYEAKFGSIGAAGSKIFVRVSRVNTATGERSTYQTLEVTVAA